MFKVKHPDFPEYFVRDDGFVERAVDSQKHPKAGDLLKGRVLVSGYRQFKLVHRDGTQRLVRAKCGNAFCRQEWNFLYATAGALSSVPEDGLRRVR